MNQFFNNIGLADGDGNTSSTRVINAAVTLCWLASKFYNSHLTHQPITWDGDDVAILGALGGIGIFKTVAEKPNQPADPATKT